MQVRRLDRQEDPAPVLDFLARVEAATGIPPLGESKFVDLGGPLSGVGLVLEGAGIEAYAHLLYHEPSAVWEMELAVPPGAGDAPISALVGEAGRYAADGMLWWTFGDTDAGRFARSRFPTRRRLHRLTGLLPLTEKPMLPSGLEVRPFRSGLDEDAFLAVNNAAFSGHPENGGWTRAELEARCRRPWFDPNGFRLAWVGEELAGFCWTKRHAGDVGEIHVIAVHPSFQGGGIGRAIVVEGLWYLAGAGCSSGLLYVDAANRSALALYQSLGFSVDRVDTCTEVPKGWPQEAQ